MKVSELEKYLKIHGCRMMRQGSNHEIWRICRRRREMGRGSFYTYPAVFTKEKDGMYSVRFPDVAGCVTCGNSITDAILMASDVLALMIYTNYEEKDIDAPSDTPLEKIPVRKNEFVSYVVCDTKTYRRRFGKKAVKKTLTIPEWLNEAATEKNINFSKVLQDALQKQIAE